MSSRFRVDVRKSRYWVNCIRYAMKNFVFDASTSFSEAPCRSMITTVNVMQFNENIVFLHVQNREISNSSEALVGPFTSTFTLESVSNTSLSLKVNVHILLFTMM